jgi:hypothetical protein
LEEDKWTDNQLNELAFGIYVTIKIAIGFVLASYALTFTHHPLAISVCFVCRIALSPADPPTLISTR